MNIHILSLLNDMAEQTMYNFSRLPFVKSAIYADNLQLLSVQIKRLAEFYVTFFQTLEFLPFDMTFYKRSLLGTYEYYDEIKHSDPMIKEVLNSYPHKELLEMKSIAPIHIRYTDENNLYLVSGLSWIENRKKVQLQLNEFFLPKDLIITPPQHLSYLIDVLQDYDPAEYPKIQDMTVARGLYYNQFIRDCKSFFGDTFYAFFTKLKMIEAVNDIIFTRMPLKEIAFRNKFTNYAKMYKTFVRYGVNIAEIPRLLYS
ncbi:hypothetical protein BBI01_06660 [Chryseobacterium artocarpi]|uniref:Uncharacterized protein n=1 Tax=Chryseobacterium artocarpi TaxID=1414727 RepID=A0A1B8ZXQ8_9FLAO|nr:helix-turn-helix transcriptional regulator [Chryseobacterium artocarpi]OCA76369.1 hypothetical protein BBI01_06660 [Chryseobacterium artocarpi]